MRRIVMIVTFLASPLPVWAGVYNSEERLTPLIAGAGAAPLEFGDFKALRDDRRAPLAGKDDNELKKHYTQKATELQGKAFAGTATVDEKINLSAYLIGLGKYDQAARLLEADARGPERGNFRLLANLATAYFLAGQLERAAGYQRQVLDNWPRQAAGFTAEQLAWLKTAETRLWVLFMLRDKEVTDRVITIHAPDDLFKVRFVDKDGKYTPGKLPDDQKLQPDALAITQQLVLWLPFDNRLYWLLGELLNAQGQQRDALGVFDELIWTGYNVPELKEHRTAIQESLPQPEPPPPALDLTPRVIVILATAGGLILFFCYLQVREIRRRKQTVSSGP